MDGSRWARPPARQEEPVDRAVRMQDTPYLHYLAPAVIAAILFHQAKVILISVMLVVLRIHRINVVVVVPLLCTCCQEVHRRRQRVAAPLLARSPRHHKGNLHLVKRLYQRLLRVPRQTDKAPQLHRHQIRRHQVL